ncbi:MAG TPA: class I SAM-dependent methyltransferase, partial [Kribbella sp.]|nr:class I SAM-dependent methyltransferase [Kribbella sp.]
SVLDVGCATGSLLAKAREEGHTGRLAGIDPDLAMLERARRRVPDADWVEGKAADIAWVGEFEVAVMASNAFQFLVTDLEESLTRIRAALVDGGRFVFATRNPEVREWESWNPTNPYDIVDHNGRELRMIYHVEEVEGDVVTFTETTALRDDTPLRTDRASLNFLGVDTLNAVLTMAGFTVEAQYGDWTRGPLTSTSEDIITVARR